MGGFGLIYNELKSRGRYDLPMELYHIDVNHPKYEMAYHWHSEFEIIRILAGSLKVRLNSREFVATEGDIIFVNSETVHGATPDNCIYECIVLAHEVLAVNDKVCGQLISNLVEHVVAVNDHFKSNEKRISDSVNHLFDIMNSNASYFEAIGALYSVFGVILKDKLYKASSGFAKEDTVKNSKLKKVLSFMRKNYSAPLTLEQISEVAGMSPKYFCYFFKEMTQKTPINYLNTYRIERAARKLLTTDLSVTDIAYGCGFNDLSYFIKTFKSIKGITPNGLRKKGE